MAGRGREGTAHSIGEALEELMDSEAFTRYSGNERAAQAWFRANGDFEHRHTRGVFLKESSRRGEAPTLYVYIDSSAMLQDFVTNRDIYAIRLAHYGFDVAKVEFRLSKGEGTRYEPPKVVTRKPPVLPDLTEDEASFVEESVASLDGAMRERVRAAMISSLRREKSLSTQESKTSPQNGS